MADIDLHASVHTFIVTTDNGSRDWQADNADHAREQHLDAFAGHPGEEIISVRMIDGSTPLPPNDSQEN